MAKQLKILFFLGIHGLLSGQGVTISFKDTGVLFTERKDSILFYQTAIKEQNGKLGRSNYIHPLYCLDGDVLTEDFPEDHPHHRGIFWAWHQLYINNERIGDGWLLQDFSCKVVSVEPLESNYDSKKIKARIVWQSSLWLNDFGKQKPLVDEECEITVYPREKSYRQIDLKISLRACEPNMAIGGSEDEKGYGGFSARIKLSDDVVFSNIDGLVTPTLLPLKGIGWVNIANPDFGFSILPHPENPGYPNPWILRKKRSMQNAVYPSSGKNAINLSNTEPTVLCYRLLVHNGLSTKDIAKVHANYGK